MEFIVLIVVVFSFFIWGVFCGWNAREEYAKKIIQKHFVQNTEELIKEIEKDVKHIIIEKHNDIFYVYDKSTKEFMAQGSSQQELERALSSRFPGKRFACQEDTLREVGFLS